MIANEPSADGAGKPQSRYRIEALAKGLQVLRLFDDKTTSLRLSEICDVTGIPMPTAFRIVSTLEEGGFLERNGDGEVRPGLGVLTLGSSALRGSGLVQISEKPLADLALATGETVNLGVLMEDQVLYLARIRNTDLVTANIHVGSTLPAIRTSMGKLLLAYLPPSEVAKKIPPESFAESSTPNSVRSMEELRIRLDEIRTQGYAIQDQELAEGLRSVSVGVYGRGGAPVAAVNIAVSTSRHDVEALRGPLLAHLRNTAELITRRLKAS